MFKGLWKTFRTQALGDTSSTKTANEQAAIDHEQLEKLGLEAWNSLNELAETVWKFFQDRHFPNGRRPLSVESYEIDLLESHQRLNRIIAALKEHDFDQATHLLAFSGETLRQCGAVCQTLMDARKGAVDLKTLSGQELAEHAARYLPAHDVDILLRPRPPTPVTLDEIESRERIVAWRELRHS